MANKTKQKTKTVLLKRARKETCLDGLKCLKKDLFLLCQFSFNCCKFFLSSTLLTSTKKAFNCFSMVSSF